MIKAVVLDIDGVIVGTKEGYNFPDPSSYVISALNKIHDNGVPVALCSAKSSFAVSKTIKKINLDNLHIADAGAVLFNPVRDEIVFERKIEAPLLNKLLSVIRKYPLLTMFFTPYKYFSQSFDDRNFKEKHEILMGMPPVYVKDFADVVKKEDVVKVLFFTSDSSIKESIDQELISNRIPLSWAWASAPAIRPFIALVVTASNVSKKTGLEHLAEHMKVDLDSILGVGDHIQDWDFISLCGYKGTLNNASSDLLSKFDFSDKKQYMGKHVDEDGIIDILSHFKLL